MENKHPNRIFLFGYLQHIKHYASNHLCAWRYPGFRAYGSPVMLWGEVGEVKRWGEGV
jgi:hypothetical protein